MLDPNIFAILSANGQNAIAIQAFALPENVHYYSEAPEYVQVAGEPTIGSREPTPAERPEFVESRIILRLDRLPKDPQVGWQFGTNPRVCDILLGHRGTSGISNRHFRIVITDDFHVYLYDESTHGTRIGYDDQLQDSRLKNDRRILSFEPGSYNPWRQVVVRTHQESGLAIKIEFPNHREGTREYRKNLRAFVRACKESLPSAGGLALDSVPSTAPLSQAPTPGQTLDRFNAGEIGRGAFGYVCKVIDVRDGQYFAAKFFHRRSSSGKKRKPEEDLANVIRNEVEIMRDNPHPNIMQMISFQEEPKPMLLMPYYSLGNLEDRKDVKSTQYISSFRQLLLGLQHLHERGVVHRDLKPANVLIAKMKPFTIVISDFGISKVMKGDELLGTFCGTRPYMAPEIVPLSGERRSQGYRSTVDIWSAGVIFLKFIHTLPSDSDMGDLLVGEWVQVWSDRTVQHVDENDEDGDQIIDLVKHMIVKEPRSRLSAGECLQRGCDNGLFRRCDDGRIVDADDPSGVFIVTKKEIAHPRLPDPGASDLGVDNSNGSARNNSKPDEHTSASKQSHQARGSDGSSAARSILSGNLGDRGVSDYQKSDESPSGSLTLTAGSLSGPSPRRRKMSHSSSWSLTIGPESINSDGGLSLDGGEDDLETIANQLLIKQDEFTVSLLDQSTTVPSRKERDMSLVAGPETQTVSSSLEAAVRRLRE